MAVDIKICQGTAVPKTTDVSYKLPLLKSSDNKNITQRERESKRLKSQWLITVKSDVNYSNRWIKAIKRFREYAVKINVTVSVPKRPSGTHLCREWYTVVVVVRKSGD